MRLCLQVQPYAVHCSYDAIHRVNCAVNQSEAHLSIGTTCCTTRQGRSLRKTYQSKAGTKTRALRNPCAITMRRQALTDIHVWCCSVAANDPIAWRAVAFSGRYDSELRIGCVPQREAIIKSSQCTKASQPSMKASSSASRAFLETISSRTAISTCSSISAFKTRS